MKRKIVVISAILFCILGASAQTYWQGPVGIPADWTIPGNWVGGIVPANNARINNGGIAEISGGTVECTSIYAGRDGWGSLRISSDGVLTNAEIHAGYNAPGGQVEINGNVLSPEKILYVGYAAGGTGTVAMTGGNLLLRNYLVGNSGTGSFVLSNGTVTTTWWQTFVGNASGSDGTFTQSGGTNTYSSASCYIAYGTGSTGRYILNGGTLSAPNVIVGNSGDGYLELNGGTLNVPGKVSAGYGSSATGTIVMNNYTNTFPNLILGRDWSSQRYPGGTSICTMNGGDITIANLDIASEPECVGTFIQNGGTLKAFSLTLPDDVDATSGTLIIRSNAVAQLDNIYVNNGGSFIINDSDVSMKSLYVRGSDTCIEMNSGSLTQSGIFYLPDGTNAATFHFNGGCLTRLPVVNQSYQFYIGGASANSGPGTFIQTGGVWTNETGLYLGRYSTNHVGRYEISGGTLYSPSSDLNIEKTRVAEFRLTGSAPDVTFRSLNSGTNEFLLEYVLDKSPEHLAPINFTYDRAYRCGHLRVGFDGGVLLSKTNEYTLLQWNTNTSAGYGDYITKPDGNMWTETLATASPASSRITLSDGYKQGDFSIGGTTSASFAERAMGHVTVANISTNRLIGLVVRMAVNEQVKNVTNLVDDMIAAGYTNSVVESSGSYDLKLVIPPEYVVDRSVKTPSIFAWDFTDPTTGVTNATVTAVSFELEHPPAMGTRFMLQ